MRQSTARQPVSLASPCKQAAPLPSFANALALRLYAEQQASQAEADGAGSPGGDVEAAAAQHEAQGGSSAPPFGLPTSLVKRIITMDPDVQRISADGVRSIAKAGELFIQLLAGKAFHHAAQHKRKNLRFQDIEAVAGRDRRMLDMGLKEVLATDACFAEVSGLRLGWGGVERSGLRWEG